MTNSKYSKGDRVIYGSNGICVVDDIKKLDFSRDKQRLYYVLKPVENQNSTLYVPTDGDTAENKLRYILTKEEIDAVLSGARDRTMEWTDDKNARAECFHEVLSNGINEDFILMIGCIFQHRQKQQKSGKKLTGADDMILQSAEKLVREEFADALGVSPDEVGEYIRAALGIENE